ncbi:signal peptidase I [Streptoalloteichus hindustanus]|uniref:Signal peptidase I n=1 Tax=Streptoalloteichus hindustanus TaxID=2017 RepID=A0A1M5GYC4_STRHI|nr:signal peptidase I [Streptoalloteichus hindustanus]SHG08731.1 signal peptidase I [Streptoalloteichus hindustanus]
MADVVPSTAPQDDPDRTAGAAGGSSDPGGSGSSSGERRKKKGSFWREFPLLVLTALVLTFLIQTFLARVYVIPSQSMEQTLHGCGGCTNDRVLVDKVTYRFSDPGPGDVVVFKGPDSWGRNSEFAGSRSSNPVVRWFQDLGSAVGIGQPDERDFVKRVIAVGGQTVEWDAEAKKVKVDGKLLDEPYIHWEEGTGPENVEPFGPVTVPAGHLWMMGDNRNFSADSRAHMQDDAQGTVPVDNVIGKARVIVLPPSRWQGIGDHNPQAQASALGAPVWQAGIPLGIGVAGAFPVLWIGRRLRARLPIQRARLPIQRGRRDQE